MDAEQERERERAREGREVIMRMRKNEKSSPITFRWFLNVKFNRLVLEILYTIQFISYAKR